MAAQFLHETLWEHIVQLAKKAKRRYVAVAYLGTGAADMLPLGRRDLLVTDASLAAVRAGQTNPQTILDLLARGVVVHSCPALHAKVFVFDKSAIVGSANLSHHSQNGLLEAAILTREPSAVAEARAFVQSLAGEQ